MYVRSDEPSTLPGARPVHSIRAARTRRSERGLVLWKHWMASISPDPGIREGFLVEAACKPGWGEPSEEGKKGRLQQAEHPRRP